MKLLVIALFFISFLVGCAHQSQSLNSVEVLSISDVKWEKLNPARGDKSPQAATLWGDRKGEVPTGFLVKFVDGFSSPPHIHNVSYKGIVINGLIHNDDPRAANSWMPKGSYWTQPAGEAHITSAKGKSNMAFIEINKGPYLVRPAKQAFDNGERPFNIHTTNIIWRDHEGVKKVELWKNKTGRVTGSMIKFKDTLRLDIEDANLVSIDGKISFQEQNLSPGSSIRIKNRARVRLNCSQNIECILYAQSDKGFAVQK